MRELLVRIGSWLKKRAAKVSGAIDNVSLMRKMLLFGVICVAVPLIITDTVLVGSIAAAEQQRMVAEQDNDIISAKNCLDNMSKYMNNAMVSLYTGTELYTFLDKQYDNPIEYYEAYFRNKDTIRNVMYGANTYIRNLTVYADNDTLYGGGGVYKLSAAREEDWYKFFTQSERETVVYTNAERTYYSYDKQRIISLISYLKFRQYSSSGEKIARFDLNYSYFTEILRQQSFTHDVYICNDDYILFSTTDKSTGTGDFNPVSDIDEERVVARSGYFINGQQWEIKIVKRDENQPLLVSALKKNSWFYLVFVLANILIPFTAIYFFYRSIVRRIVDVTDHISMVRDEKYRAIEADPAKDEIGELIRNYNLMVERIQELIKKEIEGKVRQRDYEIARQRAELLALRSQINPHFLFNALESIRMRSLIKNETETAEAIEHLAVLMRKSTEWSDDLVTLEEEAGFAEAYLRLQQYRFGDRLSYTIDISDECRGLYVPKLTMVTFVENACVHGVERISRSCTVLLSATVEDDCFVLYIEDTGAGINEEKCAEILKEMREGDIEKLMGSRSVGIMNACLRLRRCFEGSVEFDLDSEENVGTCVTIRIPTEKMKRAKELDSDA